jgi:GNAT superfamily N-acetyltransferase
MEITGSYRESFTIRTGLWPGDLGWIVHRHGVLYREEHGFDTTFEAYVARTMGEMAERASTRDRIWIAEREVAGSRPDDIVGCIAIVQVSPTQGQLRWFYLEPLARGRGLGMRLVGEAIGFCRESRFESVILWTVDLLTAAARLYEAAGFRKVEERPGRRYGVDLVEERYELRL